ncbi:titin-like isoform X2 [Ischnura elegans]|uniref:titin-like isoform X2 n=1 Tax=Ischnura elegans TaxID=197161 RepID=UPI001ED8B16D|nr:titin-like isoform X2 [Ischnura elegans]
MVFIYQMPAANAGRGGGAGGGAAAPGQRTVFRPPWVKDGSEAAAPPPPTGPPWRRQSRSAAPADDAASGAANNSSSGPAKSSVVDAAPAADKKVKVIPIARPDEGKAASGEGEARRTRAPGKTQSSAPEAKVIPIKMVDETPPAEKKSKVIPIQRVDSNAREEPVSRRSRAAETNEAPPSRGRLQRQETGGRSEVERRPGREDGGQPVENGFPANRRTSQPQQKAPPKPPEMQRQQSQPKGRPDRSPAAPPPPPPPPPMAPAPPPMPSGDIKRQDLTQERKAKIEALRSRPRRRPDWAEMMKEVESGIKLKHVQCNDRSKPLLPKVKAKGQFIYETEQKNIHNQLLNQIQQGVRLKKAETNDRSRPNLEGLRKFRRQMTIEEQIQQAEEEAAVEPDELDDIDKVRDDLQSTKQMLALELANKVQAEKENRLLQAKVFAIEEQLEKERERARKAEEERDRLKEATDCGIPGIGDPLDALRAQVALAGKTAYDYQQKYQDACRRLELTKATLEDEEHKVLLLEKKLEAALKGKEGSGPTAPTCTVAVQTDPVVVVGSEVIPLTKQPSRKEIARAVAAAAAQQLPKQQDGKTEEEDEESEYTEESCSGSEEESEDEEAKAERRHQREMKMLASKLKSYREKEGSAKKERRALKEQHGRLTKTLNTEKSKYRKLQKEVDKMAKLMKEGDDDEEEEEEAEEEEEESSEEESSEEESSEEEDDTTIPPEDPKAPPEKKTFRFEQMIKKHENSLAALKKGNYMLKANIDRLKDELEKQKEMYVSLQEDLNSVLAELG